MSDLISRKRIEFELCESNIPKRYRDFCRRVINSESLSPSVDAVEVVHGRWIRNLWFVTCSICDYSSADKDDEGDYLALNYCPNCGAKMDEVSE